MYLDNTSYMIKKTTMKINQELILPVQIDRASMKDNIFFISLPLFHLEGGEGICPHPHHISRGLAI